MTVNLFIPIRKVGFAEYSGCGKIGRHFHCDGSRRVVNKSPHKVKDETKSQGVKSH